MLIIGNFHVLMQDLLLMSSRVKVKRDGWLMNSLININVQGGV
jgi:hypothetical protein